MHALFWSQPIKSRESMYKPQDLKKFLKEILSNFRQKTKNIRFCTRGNQLLQFNFKFLQGNITLTLSKPSYIWQLFTVKTKSDTFVLMITTEQYCGHLGEVWKFSETLPEWNFLVSIKTTPRRYSDAYFSKYQESSIYSFS